MAENSFLKLNFVVNGSGKQIKTAKMISEYNLHIGYEDGTLDE